jgi:hypothetical protein
MNKLFLSQHHYSTLHTTFQLTVGTVVDTDPDWIRIQ